MKYTSSAIMAALFAAQTFAASGVFDYKQNGEDWGNDNPLCKFGTEQSPIDLTQSGTETSEDMQLNGYGYKDYPTQVVYRTDHTIVVNVGEGEFQLDFHDGSKSLFTPLQFHFHAPSEHSVNGKLYDLEMHIVHYYKDTNVSLGAVIGVFFDREAGGSFNNPFLDSLKFGETVKGEDGIQVENANLASFIGSIDFRKYWNYRGSLTTPPCSEGIKWTVIEEVQPISDLQLTAFNQFFSGNQGYAFGNGNNRKVMPLNQRTLYYSQASTLFASVASMAATVAYFVF